MTLRKKVLAQRNTVFPYSQAKIGQDPPISLTEVDSGFRVPSMQRIASSITALVIASESVSKRASQCQRPWRTKLARPCVEFTFSEVLLTTQRRPPQQG